MQYPKRIFLTGGTGFLGSQILKLILENNKSEVFLLIRPKGGQSIERRFEELFLQLFPNKKDRNFLREKIKLLQGDVVKGRFGLDGVSYQKLISEVEEIYHCAALAEFRQPLSRVRKHNVEGTKNVLEFARQCKNLNKMNYVSTAFIAGNLIGRFSEQDLDVGQSFNNTYEQSKFEGELLVKEYVTKGIKVAIYRPSIVGGIYDNGYTDNFRMFYQPFRTISLSLLPKIPISNFGILNLIPCDYAAKAIYLLSISRNKVDTYHIVGLENFSVKYLMRFTSNFFKYKEPKYINLSKFNINEYSPLVRQILKVYIPYFNFGAIFDCEKTKRILLSLGFSYPKVDESYLSRIFEYSYKEGYIKKSLCR
ncbi:MAG: SDR family oxidoreductase [Candidatus Omnitrophica bacterium]|nr:SDR family oxidoreductase [Candidatus Omnitrophota bacterium]